MKFIIYLSVIGLSLISGLHLQAQTVEMQSMIRNSGTASEYPKSQVLTLFDSTIVLVEESGLSHFQTHTLQKVLTSKGGYNLSSVKFSYDPFSAMMLVKKVRIYRKDGGIEDVLPSRIYDYPQPANLILWGAREIMIAPGHLDVGDALEIITYKKGFSYALLMDNEDDKYIPPMRGHFYDIIPFWASEDVLAKVYQVSLPSNKELNYRVFNEQMDIVVTAENNLKILTFTSKNIKPFVQERGMVSLWDVAPKLIMTTAPDWQAKSRWFYGVNEDFGSFESGQELKGKVNEILIGAKNEMDSVSRLTHWVADNIRYMGLNMGPGEGFTLHKADMTFTDRCGVCKDKAGILVAMLRAAGFESYAAMTMAGSKIEDIPADHFNHSVTAVRLSDGKLHMLDPTWVPWVRELWSSREQQQNYIIGTKSGEDLEEIPVSPPENHFLKISVNSKLIPDGSLEGELILVAEGQSDALIRSPLTRNYRQLWDEIILRELLDVYPAMKVMYLSYSDPYDYSSPFSLKINFLIKDFALVSNQYALFTPMLAQPVFKSLNPYLRIPSDQEVRKYNFRDVCSQQIELEERLTFPEKWLESNQDILLPQKRSSDGSGASFLCEYKKDANTLHFTQKTTLKKRIYSPEDWASFRDALINRSYYSSQKIIISK